MGLLERQLGLQREGYGIEPSTLAGEDLVEYIRMNVLAATDELHEALREVPGWKPWSDSEPPEHLSIETVEGEMFVDELVDVLHFVANVINTTGITDEELEERYERKRAENLRRRREGYEG